MAKMRIPSSLKNIWKNWAMLLIIPNWRPLPRWLATCGMYWVAATCLWMAGGGMFDYVGSNYLKYDTGIPKEDGSGTYKEKYATDELKLYYQDAVKAADIMTLCLGNAEFGAYLLNRITDALGVMGGKTYS